MILEGDRGIYISAFNILLLESYISVSTYVYIIYLPFRDKIVMDFVVVFCFNVALTSNNFLSTLRLK